MKKVIVVVLVLVLGLAACGGGEGNDEVEQLRAVQEPTVEFVYATPPPAIVTHEEVLVEEVLVEEALVEIVVGGVSNGGTPQQAGGFNPDIQAGGFDPNAPVEDGSNGIEFTVLSVFTYTLEHLDGTIEVIEAYTEK